jgi:hypothetical protein
MPSTSAITPNDRRVLRRLRALGSDLAGRPRIVLALKAAAAAALAWYLAPFVPFADAEYSYYAPLGVLLSMYPTLVDSARSGLQVVAGLALGIGLGLGGLSLVSAGAPGVVAVAAVIAVGVWIGGLRALGSGRELVAVAGLFVLLIGGRNPDEFSMSYLITMAFGVLVGIAVNLLVFPPLYLQRASGRLSSLRDSVAARLDGLAEAVEHGQIDTDRIEREMDDLAETVSAVSAEVREATASTRGNPRGRRRTGEAAENTARLRALERTVFFTRDLADVLARDGAISASSVSPGLVEAIRRCAVLVATPLRSEDAESHLRAASEAIDRLMTGLDELADVRPSGMAQDLTAAICLRRIVDASRPFV